MRNFQNLSESTRIIRRSFLNDCYPAVVKYLHVQQGAMFMTNENESGSVVLEMTACYAYEKAKVLEQVIEPGQGLVGQCFEEGRIVHMNEVPEGYINISSGLGGTNPRNIVLVPMIFNESIEGVLELASLEAFKAHEIDFLSKLGEVIASAIVNKRYSEKTKVLLSESEQQREEMQSQEEEMRQNMEELQATQEQMARKNLEFEERIKKSSKREKELLAELKILKKK